MLKAFRLNDEIAYPAPLTVAWLLSVVADYPALAWYGQQGFAANPLW